MATGIPLSEWLAGLGLARYAEVFAANAVGLDVLPQLTEEDLKGLGIPLGDRKRILVAVKALEATAPLTAGAASVAPESSPGLQGDAVSSP